jgi:hypothetical protein
MGLGIRLGPIRVGTGGAGIGVGPIYASTGFGSGRRGSSSGPTKTQLRDSAITDYRWSIGQRPRSFLGHFDRPVDTAIGKGEAGAAAEAIVRYWIRQHGNTKATLGWIARDASFQRSRITGEISQSAAALKRQKQAALEKALAHSKAQKKSVRRATNEQKWDFKLQSTNVSSFGRVWAIAWRLVVAVVASLSLAVILAAVVEQLAGPWEQGEEPAWWAILLWVFWVAGGVVLWRVLRRRQCRRRQRIPVHEPAPREGSSPPPYPQAALSAIAQQAAHTGSPGWYADPFGRFSYRYWDKEWTSTASSNGRSYEDAPDC